MRRHEPDGLRLTPIEYRAYCQGYDHALRQSLLVMEFAARQFHARAAERRRKTRESVAREEVGVR